MAGMMIRRWTASPGSTVRPLLAWRALGCRNICSGRLGFLSQPMPLDTADTPVESFPCPGRKVLEVFKEEFEVGSRSITLETGKIARFANGSVVIGMEQTKVLSTVVSAKSGDGVSDFLPLTVDYQEKQYAQGVIPTTFMRREGAPKERELLCSRLVDRPIRPLFPPGFYHQVQVMVNVLSSDGEQDPDVMAANATSAALVLSDIPWDGPIGVIRVGRIEGQLIFNPTMDELSLSDLNLVYACTCDKTLMIDVQAREITERDLEGALKLAHPEALKYIQPQIILAKKAGKRKKEYKLSLISEATMKKISCLTEAPIESVFSDPSYGKFERGEALEMIAHDAKLVLEEQGDEESLRFLPKAVDSVRKRVVRRRIIEKGLRVDGRHLDEVRPLYCEAGTNPILHGSSLFSRGDTQVLCTVTLGAPGDAQRLDSLVGPPTKRFMLHYNFPPFCINEIGKRGGLNRREVGHGTLAEKALLAVLPPEDDFAYTVRINSEVMASDGSTSMASVCGGSMALMDAGIPLRGHVAGVSVGLVSDMDPLSGMIRDYRILTDILGLEDHLGDMDFKIAGTRKGITAIQLDIKPAGIPLDIICESLSHARNGRNHILDRMEEEINTPRTQDDTNAPRLLTMKLSNYGLRRLLGPQGSQKKKIEEETGARFSFGDKILTIVAKNQSVMEKAQDKIDSLIGQEIEVGRIYKGVVGSIKEYGAFVELRGGQHGLLHISELSHEQVSRVADVVSVGQELSLMCIGQDVRGNIKLSMKAIIPQPQFEPKGATDEASVSNMKQEINVLASVGDVPSSSVTDTSQSNHVTDEEDVSATYQVPSIVIRGAAECEAQEIPTIREIDEKHTSPRPCNSRKSQVSRGSPKPTEVPSRNSDVINSTLASPGKRRTQNDTSERDASEQAQARDKPKSLQTSRVKANLLKLGDKIKAKVYQVRAHGLVLDLGGGVKGMYKFEANGRRDFEVGEELHVKCSTFSSKGIPVMSLLDGN